MNWITMLGITLVSGGMFQFYYGQDLKNRLDNQHIHQSIKEKIHEVDQLVNSNNELYSNADKYEKSLSEKGKTIHRLTAQLDKQNEAAEEYQQSLSVKDEILHQLTEQVDKQNVVAGERQKSLSEKDETIHQLTEQVNKQSVAAEGYQKSLSEKDEIIYQLTAEVDKQKSPEEYKNNLSKRDTTTKQHKSWFNKLLNISKSKQLTVAKKESGHQDLTETDYSEEIAHARRLYNEGKYDEAYIIADDLRQKNPDFGLAYLILGTTEMHNKHYDKGERLLIEAVQLGLSDKDRAWAFHNLGISLVRNKNYEKAGEFLEKSVELNPTSEKSRMVLKLLNDYLQKKSLIIKAKGLCKLGKYDEAYRIADDLRQKYPEDGLPYYILGTIEMRKEHYDKGEDLLNKAVKLKQSDEDKAWVYYILGMSSARKNNFEKAREYLVKAVELDPNMKESKEALKQLNNLN